MKHAIPVPALVALAALTTLVVPGCSSNSAPTATATPSATAQPSPSTNSTLFIGARHLPGVLDGVRTSPAIVSATADYRSWVSTRAAELHAHVVALGDRIEAGDLAGAKSAYATARVSFGEIQPIAEGYRRLRTEIDGQPEDFTRPADFVGFHRIEKGLWAGRSTNGLAPFATKLAGDTKLLADLIGKQPIELVDTAYGVTSSLSRINGTMLGGQTERWSGLTLVDVRAYLDGSMKLIDHVAPALQTVNPELLADISGQRGRVNAILTSVGVHSNVATVPAFNTVSASWRVGLARQVGALAEVTSLLAVEKNA